MTDHRDSDEEPTPTNDQARLRERVAALEALVAEIAPRGTAAGGYLGSQSGGQRLQPDGGSATYKILGQLDESNNGIGVLGCNVASSGTTYGVKGEVDSPDGYGLATPDDAKVDGTAELGGLAGAVTGGQQVTSLTGTGLVVDAGTLELTDSPPYNELPPYDTVGNDPQGTIDTLETRFPPEKNWGTPETDPGYVSGVSPSVSGTFDGAVLAPTGEMILVPGSADNVGIYDPTTDTFVSGPSHGGTPDAFSGGALAPTGEVIFAPYRDSNVGRYDPSAREYTAGDTHGENDLAFNGAAVAPTGDVIFVPKNSTNIGVYDPFNDSYSHGPPHNEGGNAFWGAALAPTGDIVLAPDRSSHVGIYDPEANSYTQGPTHGEGDEAFAGAALAPTGEIIFAPKKSANVGVYDPVANSYTSGDSVSTLGSAFAGAALAPTGEVIFAPSEFAGVGVYDPVTDSYATGPTHGQTGYAFYGAVPTPSGTVVFAPRDSDAVGKSPTWATTDLDTALHPLMNNC